MVSSDVNFIRTFSTGITRDRSTLRVSPNVTYVVYWLIFRSTELTVAMRSRTKAQPLTFLGETTEAEQVTVFPFASGELSTLSSAWTRRTGKLRRFTPSTLSKL